MLTDILILGKRTFLDSCICCLLKESGFNVILADDTEVKAGDMINSIQPDIVIIISYDSTMADLANSLKEQYNQQIIAILSFIGEKDDIYSALSMDMEGYLSMLSPPEELIEDIKAISKGEKRVSRKLMSALIRTWKNDMKSPDKNMSNLKITSRELDILNLMAKGKTNKEIGIELNLSPNTVKYLISHLFVKFSANSRADVVYKGYSILKKNKLK